MKMQSAGITLRRTPYEEPYHLRLEISASNGVFSGRLEFYCNADDLEKIGAILSKFPQKYPGKYVYELGSEKPEVRSAYYLRLCAFTTDYAGHCALSIVLNNNEPLPDTESCSFRIDSEVAAINRLGEYLIEFGRFEHREMIWLANGEGGLNKDVVYPDNGTGL